MFQNFLPNCEARSLAVEPDRDRLSQVDRQRLRSEARSWDTSLNKDLKTLARFIDLYCSCKHASGLRTRAEIPGFDVEEIARKKVTLCPECTKLLTHAFVKRSRCPMNPKPQCKHCTRHCYHPNYRDTIREVMRFSGKRMMMTGRLDYIFHLLF